MINHNQIKPHLKKSLNYSDYGNYIKNPMGRLYYQDNGNDVLAVAHLDYVLWCTPKYRGNYIFCPQLDDRLGVAVILEWLPTIGNFDILLCDKEEICQSTGRFFKPKKQYRYMIEFDRAGSDFVSYQYAGGKLYHSFKRCGWKNGEGSYSDIVNIDIGCEGVNIGVGYHNAHTKDCYCNLAEVNSQLAKFSVWYKYYNKTI